MAINYRLLVFLTALATLMFELVASRLADFHLGAGNAYLAIPVTFLGLALGSLHVHSRPRIVERFSPLVSLSVLALVCSFSLLAAFVVFAKALPVVSAVEVARNLKYLLLKTLAFIGILLPSFYVFGRILTVCYQIKRQEIGAVYSADFWGAAVACALTPILFHFGGLPKVSLVLLGSAFLPVLLFCGGSFVRRAALAVVLLTACWGGAWVISTMDDSLEYGRYGSEFEYEEVTHGWNEHSRVALLSRHKRGKNREFRIVHDDSRSNVHVWPYRASWVGREPLRLEALEVPAILKRPIRSVLVMFAGCGAEMIKLNEMLAGKARITGVELNPLVRDLAVDTEQLQSYDLQGFYDLPHIELVLDEGRRFLSTTSDRYDLIFVGSNAATGVWLTGHSRKYLDTTEAFHLYLDHLADGGLMIFDHQPVGRRMQTMKRVFEERRLPSFSDRVIVLDSLWGDDDMLVSPSGFKGSEVARLVMAAGNAPDRVRYAPGRENNDATYERMVNGSLERGQAMTDDRPFLFGLDWKEYSPVPDAADVRRMRGQPQRYLNWIKITTLVVLVAISLVFIVIVAVGTRSSADLPLPVLFYLLVTGFCFMLVEIAMIAKLELFLQEPIVSMAAVLSTFLLTSGVGSRMFPRIARRLKIVALALSVALLVAGSIYAMEFVNSRLLGLPLAAKLPIAFALMAPVGFSLGLFYPYAVSCLVTNDRPRAVSITYGLSTLSSVIGATYAMTIMLDTGFASLLWQASAGYLLLSLYLLAYSRVLKGRQLTLAV